MGSIECGAVLFDLDGVLVDSTPAVTRVWRGWAMEHGYDPAGIVKLAHGRRAIETVELVAPHLDSAAELVELERRELEDTDGLIVFRERHGCWRPCRRSAGRWSPPELADWPPSAFDWQACQSRKRWFQPTR